MARHLIEMGARVDNTSTGETALHIAAREDQLEVMRLLLEFGADPNALDVDGSPRSIAPGPYPLWTCYLMREPARNLSGLGTRDILSKSILRSLHT